MTDPESISSELIALKQQLVELEQENTELKEKQQLYIRFSKKMLNSVDCIADKDIAEEYNMCTTCARMHPCDITNVFKCCLEKKQARGRIYCPNCWSRGRLLENNKCNVCDSDIYKCEGCNALYLDEDELLQCCPDEKVASGKLVKCPFCSKAISKDINYCIFCREDISLCEICKKIYKTDEEESKCCADIKLSSGDFIMCKSCNIIINKKLTKDNLTCRSCVILVGYS